MPPDAGKLPFDALVFDLGNVIVPHDNAVMHRRIAARCTAPEALERLETTVYGEAYSTGRKKIAELHASLRRECGYALDWDGFVADWCSHLTIDGAMLDLVRRLAESNRVLIFSNTNHEHWMHLLALSGGALGAFEAYLSHELGQMKPSPEAFLEVAARAGIAPERSLFVDDLAVNVQGARQAGFQGFVFTDRASFEDWLRLCAS